MTRVWKWKPYEDLVRESYLAGDSATKIAARIPGASAFTVGSIIKIMRQRGSFPPPAETKAIRVKRGVIGASNWAVHDPLIAEAWGQGKTSLAIASMIPGATKGAISGRIRWMRARGLLAIDGPARAMVRGLAAKKPSKAPRQALGNAAPKPVLVAPDTKGVTFAEWEPGMCLCPVGGAGEALFCGAPAEDTMRAGARSRWCAYHAAMAFIPGRQPRQRQNRRHHGKRFNFAGSGGNW